MSVKRDFGTLRVTNRLPDSGVIRDLVLIKCTRRGCGYSKRISYKSLGRFTTNCPYCLLKGLK